MISIRGIINFVPGDVILNGKKERRKPFHGPMIKAEKTTQTGRAGFRMLI